MLLSFNHPHHHHHRIFPSSPVIPYSSPLLFPIPKTLIFRSSSIHLNNQTPSSKSVARSSSIHHQDHPKTLPHSAIQRIAEKLRSLGLTENPKSNYPETETKSAGEIFIPLPNQLPKYRVGHTLDPSWCTPENPVPVPGTGDAILKYHDLRKEVKREREAKKAERRVPWLAELSLGEDELRRLRRIGIAERKKLNVGKAGITEGIVNGIHERWRRAEVVKIVCEDLCKMNMKRTHDLLERKTGGLVVWRAGSKIVLYRGVNYKYPYFLADNSSVNETSCDGEPHMDAGRIDEVGSAVDVVDGVESSGPSLTNKMVQRNLVQGIGSPIRVRFQLPGEAQLTEEVDHWLHRLGPRFTDWWGYDLLPVDADLLPAVIPGYRRPFRLLPYAIKSTLTNDEMTTLKRLGRPLPCHFALGRNRKLQGLAASIVKLWEKCEIAKIAIKRGVQNTNSELMAEELKFLTGGTLLSRDREFIVLYRGKDFLPSAASSAIQDRRKLGIQRIRQWRDCTKAHETAEELKDGTIDAGTRGESEGVNDWKHDLSGNKKLRSTEAAINKTSIKLSMALEKKAKAEKLLAELEKSEMPRLPEDKEGITEEERYMLRKVGLKMKPFLLMGRRGLFDGTIENMHLHWKYRELVKIICKERRFEAVQEVARTLEAESGGILVAVESVSKGYAIIVYRGKNYKRPAGLRPSTLLSKRQAMKRSLEAQRQESLKLNVLRLTKNIDHLKHRLVKDKEAHNLQSSYRSRFQVEEESNNVGLAGPTISNSELKPNCRSYTAFPAHPEEIIEVKEELNNVELAGPTVSDSELKSNCHSYTAFPAHPEEIIETMDNYETDSVAVNPNDDDVDASVKSTELPQQSYWTDLSSTFDVNESGENGHNSSFESVRNETCESLFTSISDGDVDSISCLNNSMSNDRNLSPPINANSCVSMKGEMGSLVESTKNEWQKSVPIMAEEDNQIPSKVVCLSNRDRLLLRKQALKMKKRPVLAVGRSNIVSGVAKAIKAHFQRHPLAIVNVKARAKGTSVQEVVSKLEEATGAVLVSQEPSKVILYRGWGAGDEAGLEGKKNAHAQDAGKASSEDGRVRHAVSPELMAAIRLECGLQQNQSERSTQSVEI